MKKLIGLCLSLFCLCAMAAQSPILMFDSDGKGDLPSRFRTSSDVIDANHGINTTGLSDLHIMGSRQFSVSQLAYIKNKFSNTPITIIDVRQESHGFLDGFPISWRDEHNAANRGKTNSEVEATQQALLDNLKQQTTVNVMAMMPNPQTGALQFKSIPMPPKVVLSEADLAKKMGLGYERFYVTDESQPTHAEYQRFVQFVSNVPPGTWLYFHCQAGEGRTTTFMILYDCMKNGDQVSFDDIVKRQIALGGKDFTQDKARMAGLRTMCMRIEGSRGE